MIKTNATIINQLGLHARASAKLTKLASSFQSDISLVRGERCVNAKSIMGVMMLAAGMGAEVVLEVAGPDEQAASAALLTMINQKFGEAQ
jgi:phosphocarrier protein HPr